MKCPLASSPTAAELLEATKKLYVKTDVLRQRKIEPGQPRLFQSTDDEDQCPKVSGLKEFPVAVVSPPPPPYPRSTSLSQDSPQSDQPAPGWKPVPKPRLSIMRSMMDLSNMESEQPRPKPRRKVLLSEPTTDRSPEAAPNPISIEALQNSPLAYKKKTITKSTPNVSVHSVAALKRRVQASRPATPVMHNEDPSVMFPLMDESERDFLQAAVRLTYSTDDDDSAPSSPSGGHLSVEKSCFLPSPTADSGRPNSDDEDRRTQPLELNPAQQNPSMTFRTQPCSTKSLDDGFFDSSLLKKEEETSSEALTSISNLQKEVGDYTTEEEDRGRDVSVLERNARVMRWIHGCGVLSS
ncbi:unnamed protein product [Haemonchus placei]|uniref:FAM110_C domain-containing protein n=1 Tax=Haemonchus placei TaxID=6290 RepID=A0A158QMP8_HAEPC|nr:unnamed protein product [Haemonchus placei]